MVQNGGDAVADGADEKMLGNEDKNLIGKKEEVKFITGDQQNGDAKIDIGTINKTFTGMTKEELMKYANDPFWVRLRWMFFILFWLAWIAMLVGAILIIVNAPKCSAPTPLVWYKQGPHAKFGKLEDASAKNVEIAKKLQAKGVIYELSPEDTYLVKNDHVESKIKAVIENYKDTDINVILDITPNYVTKQSKLFKEALEDHQKRTSFLWVEKPEVPNNWKSIVNGTAWDEIKPGNWILSQFGEGKYDLIMNDTNVKAELNQVFNDLLNIGVKGFRLNNAKHFLLHVDLKDEAVNSQTDRNYLHDQYGFWTHTKTTYQEGLGDLLQQYNSYIKNVSDNKAFLSVNEDMGRPEVFKNSNNDFGIDIPIYGRFATHLGGSHEKNLYTDLKNIWETVGNSAWLQWNYDFDKYDRLDASAYNVFLMLLPGVPVLDTASENLMNISSNTWEQMDNMRKSPSFMHGSFDMYHSGTLVAYSRIKSGNPGFFVVLNPTDSFATGNFSSSGLPEKMTVDLLSDGYNATGVVIKSKVMTDSIQVSANSAIILTYVPVKN
ncbi:uncharacterized protein LOC129612489 isoform X2 [Condylostylus longicornis]|nr:uncharacterized protein LOC129612489 isoform X2 [Condylostylus longicornis]